MTKKSQATSQEDHQDTTAAYSDPSFSDAEMGRILDTFTRGIGKPKYAPYGGARSYQLLPEEME